MFGKPIEERPDVDPAGRYRGNRKARHGLEQRRASDALHSLEAEGPDGRDRQAIPYRPLNLPERDGSFDRLSTH